VPQRTVFCTADQQKRMDCSVQAVRAWLAAGVEPQQMLVLAAHAPAATILRDRLSAATDPTITIRTVRQHAHALLRRFPDAAQLPDDWNETLLMSGIERRMLIKHAWAGIGSDPSSLWHARGSTPGALDWVARMFDRWSAWSGTADPQQLPHVDLVDEHVAELWHAYRRYLSLCQEHQLLAFSDVFGRATDLIRTVSDARPQPHALLLHDLDLFDPAEWLFVGELIGPRTTVSATCAGTPSATSAVDHVRVLGQWVAQQGLAVEQINAAPPPQPSIAAYASPDAEADAVAEQIASNFTGRWSDYAVVAFDHAVVPLVQRALARRGVPVAGQDARDGYTIVLAGLARIGVKLLTGQALSTIDERSLARWITPPVLDAATRAAQALRAAPSAQLHHWLQALDLPQRCWEHTAAVLPQWAVDADQAHWQRMWQFVVRAEQLAGALGTPLTPTDLLDVLLAAQALIVPTGAPHADAVQVWQPGELSGCSAQHVFAVGLHEGALPQPTEPLPFADDLLAPFAVLSGFVQPQTANRAAAWERGLADLERTMGCATSTIQWSYSRTDRAGRRQLPSPIIREQGTGNREQENKKTREQEIEGKSSLIPNVQRSNVPTFQPAVQPSVTHGVPDLQPFVASQSALEDYFVCPRRALYARQLKLHDVAAAPRQALGQIVHGALRELVQHEQRAVDQHQAAALVARHWNDGAAWGSRLKHDVFKQLAERAVEQQARYEADQVHATTLGTEVRFRWQVDDITMITGQIDRIDRDADGLHIIDYKLGQTSPSLNALLAEFVAPPGDAVWRPGDVQLPIYALAAEYGDLLGVERLSGERVASVALVYPLALYNDNGKRSTTGVRRIQIVDHADDCPACTGLRSAKQAFLCRQQLDQVLRYVHGAIERMRHRDWPADPREGARTCSSCPFRPICPAPH